MSTVARKVLSVPQRSSRDTWSAIVSLVAPDAASEAHAELVKVAGIASSLIAREAAASSPIILHGGSGPRVKVFCIHGEDAIGGDGANETALATVPTQGDWKMSLPCPAEDLSWIKEALGSETSRITAREIGTSLPGEDDGTEKSATTQDVNMEAFLKR